LVLLLIVKQKENKENKRKTAAANPVTQFGSSISLFTNNGLETGLISGKADFNASLRPQFIDALIATSFSKPSSPESNVL